MKLNPIGLGTAFGVGGALFYLGCVLLMSLAGPQALAFFFNGFLYGLNVESILETDIWLWATALGLINTFIMAWFLGALIALVYNGAVSRIGAKRRVANDSKKLPNL